MFNRMVFAGLCACVSLFFLLSVTDVRAQTPEAFTAPAQQICQGQSATYTLNIRAPDKSNTLIGVKATADPPVIPNVAYANGSQTVTGVGATPGTATINISGQVQATTGNMPFTVSVPVTVLACVAITVCTGKDFDLTLTNTVATATVTAVTPAGIATAAVAPAAAPASHVVIHGVKAGAATVTLSAPLQGNVGRVTVTVKDCPVPKTSNAPPPKKPSAAVNNAVPLENAIELGIGLGLQFGLPGGDKN
jgi:hypothetical protein